MKFFNKLRLNAMEKNKVVKYLAYAVGEIILVVIGILIAVAINDRQQDKSDKAELNRIFRVIHNDLVKDTTDVSNILRDVSFLAKLSDKIIYNKRFQRDSLANCFECKNIISSFSYPNFSRNGYKLLQNYSKDLSKNRELVNRISQFLDYNDENIKLIIDILTKEVFLGLKYFRDNKDWFKDYYSYGNCNNDCIDYFQSDEYLNKLVFHNLLITDQYIPLLENYLKESTDIIKIIEKIE